MSIEEYKEGEAEAKKTGFPDVWGPVVDMNAEIFRRGTTMQARPVNFVFYNGGMGDYINFSSAIKWVQEKCPHVMGRLFVAEPFLQVAKFLFEKPEYPFWKVLNRGDFETLYEKDSIVAAPNKNQLINATGAHLLDLGFMYYAQMQHPVKEYNFIPEIDYHSGKTWGLPERYAIFTPGFTASNREMYPYAINTLAKHAKDNGITPVFLGKLDINHVYKTSFNDEVDGSIGIDLREKTTLLEAIEIMSKAQVVVGLDNGLLNLAGTTTVPIVYGHNVSPPEYRRVRRRKGLTIDLYIPTKVLQCSGCQNKMRFVYRQKFSSCIYQDNLCLKYLFDEKNMPMWKEAINRAVNSNRKPFWKKK